MLQRRLGKNLGSHAGRLQEIRRCMGALVVLKCQMRSVTHPTSRASHRLCGPAPSLLTCGRCSRAVFTWPGARITDIALGSVVLGEGREPQWHSFRSCCRVTPAHTHRQLGSKGYLGVPVTSPSPAMRHLPSKQLQSEMLPRVKGTGGIAFRPPGCIMMKQRIPGLE